MTLNATISISASRMKLAVEERTQPPSRLPTLSTLATTNNGKKLPNGTHWLKSFVQDTSSSNIASSSSPQHGVTSFAPVVSDSLYYDGLPSGSLVWIILGVLFMFFFLLFLLWKATYPCRAERRLRAHEESAVSGGIAVDTQTESMDGEVLPTYEEAQRAALETDKNRRVVGLEEMPSRTNVHDASGVSVDREPLGDRGTGARRS